MENFYSNLTNVQKENVFTITEANICQKIVSKITEIKQNLSPSKNKDIQQESSELPENIFDHKTIKTKNGNIKV